MITLFFFSCSAPKTSDTAQISEPTSEQEQQTTTDPPAYILTTQMQLNRAGRLFITDRATGQEVWSVSNLEDPVWPDGRFSDDGNTLWHNVVDVKEHEAFKSRIQARDASGTVIEEFNVSGAHHSFDFKEDGSFYTIQTQYEITEEYGTVAGDKIVKIHSGQIEPFFNIFQWMEPEPLTQMWDFGYFEDAKDWTHANFLRWYKEHDRFLMTIPGINAIWAIDSDGSLKEVYLGAEMSPDPYDGLDITIFEGGFFELPHGATMDWEGNLWVLSSGFGGQTPSFAQGYRPTEQGLELIVSIGPHIEGAHSSGLGSVERLEDDRLLINWGIFGVVEEVDFEGTRYWSVEGGLQEVFGMSRGVRPAPAFLSNIP